MLMTATAKMIGIILLAGIVYGLALLYWRTRTVSGSIHRLGMANTKGRVSAAWALYRFGDERAIEPLILALSDSDSAVRSAVVSALDRLGGQRAGDSFMKALSDVDSNVREKAARALIQWGDQRAVEPLIQALFTDSSESDANVHIWRLLAQALKKLGLTHRQRERVAVRMAEVRDEQYNILSDLLDEFGDPRGNLIYQYHPEEGHEETWENGTGSGVFCETYVVDNPSYWTGPVPRT